MPLPGRRWRHVIFGTRGSWLPGDQRGWRSRHHKRHSTGDYKSPPPNDEHEGLHEYSLALCPEAVTIPAHLRAPMGQTLRDHVQSCDHRLLVLSVAGQHVHMLVELPDDLTTIRQIVGDAKRHASRAVRREMPGRLWAARGKYLAVNSEAHHRRAFGYIRCHRTQGAWVWTFKDGVVGPGEENG